MTMLHVKLTFNLRNNQSITFPLAWEKNCESCTSKTDYLLQGDSLHAEYDDDKRGLEYIRNVVKALHKHVELEHS